MLQKLLVTWPELKRDYTHTTRFGPGKRPQLHYIMFIVRPWFREWSLLSGVDVAMIEDRAPMLFGNGICRLDGTTASEALSLVAGRMLNAALGKVPARKK